MDVLSDILTSLRLTGGVILEGSGHGDWCVLSQMQPSDWEELLPGGGQIIAYHFVRSGRLFAQVEGEPPVEAGAGSILLLPRNDPHRLFTGFAANPVDSHQFVTGGREGRPARFEIGPEDGEQVDFYCGFLGVKGPHHPLLDCLPALLVVANSDSTQSDWLRGNLKFLTDGDATPEDIARIAELLFAHAIRRYMESAPTGESGWLSGLRDPAVARALTLIHSHYHEDLDIERLAREAGVSRTVLGERFAARLGESPMRYCAHWRMRMAANRLRDGKDNNATIAFAVGFSSEAAFNRAFKREYGEPPASWKRRVAAQHSERAGTATLPQQTVRHCTARDGTRLAYSSVGDGPPLVKTANWLNHLEHDFESPVWRHWLQELTNGHCLVRYDERGNGLSDWDTPELSFGSFVDDLETVVDAAGLDRFDLLGISQGVAVAIAYSLRHPGRVRRMVLYGGYSRGWRKRLMGDDLARRDAMVTLTRTGWGQDNPAFRQVFTNIYIPEATATQASWFNEVQRLSTSPANAALLMEVFAQIDVADLLPRVSVPTLVAHASDDQAVPFPCGEELAREIPGAQFLPLDGHNHILLEGERAWPVFVRGMRQFLGSWTDSPDPDRQVMQLPVVS